MRPYPVVSRSPCNPRRRCAVAAAFCPGDQAVSLVQGRPNFLFRRFSLLVGASAVPICERGRQRRKSRENPVDAGMNRVNLLILLKRGTPLTRSSFYVHLGLQIGLNFGPATIPGRPWIEGRGDKIEFFCRLKWTSGLVL